MGALWKASNAWDEAFFKELLKLPVFPFYQLIRQDRDQAGEQVNRWLKQEIAPTFSYPTARHFDVLGYLEAVETCRARLPKDPAWIRQLYEEKLDELRLRASLVLAIANADDQTVTHLSTKLFGLPRQDADELEKEFACMLDHAERFHEHTAPVQASMFANMVKDLLDHYDIRGWKVTLSSRSSVRITRGRRARKPVIRIPTALAISKARAARLLTHEIEVHALRTENGRRSPLHILHIGLSGYVRTDEGLAMHFQQQLAKKAPRHAPGFWDAWTCALTQQGTFADTFNTIATAKTRLAEAMGIQETEAIGQDAAWRLCKRAYRGITNTDTYGVGFLRDHLYRSGLLDVRDLIEENGQNALHDLFIGNIGIDDARRLEGHNLPSARIPELMSKMIVKKHA